MSVLASLPSHSAAAKGSTLASFLRRSGQGPAFLYTCTGLGVPSPGCLVPSYSSLANWSRTVCEMVAEWQPISPAAMASFAEMKLAFFTKGCSLPVSLYRRLYVSMIWTMRADMGCCVAGSSTLGQRVSGSSWALTSGSQVSATPRASHAQTYHYSTGWCIACRPGCRRWPGGDWRGLCPASGFPQKTGSWQRWGQGRWRGSWCNIYRGRCLRGQIHGRRGGRGQGSPVSWTRLREGSAARHGREWSWCFSCTWGRPVVLHQPCSLQLSALWSTYHARIDGKPTLILQLFRSLEEHVPVRSITELDIHPQLVAGLVVRDDGHALDVLRVHPVDVNVDYSR